MEGSCVIKILINGFLFLRRSIFFEKHLSKRCTRVYREIYVEVGEAFEAVATEASNNETRPSAEILEARPEKTSDLEVAKKPAGNFTN